MNGTGTNSQMNAPYQNNAATQRVSQNSSSGNGSSWGVIILLLIVFFPVGIYMMMHKLHIDKENIVSNARKTLIVGWIMIALGLCYPAIMASSTNAGKTTNPAASGAMMLVICCVTGIAIIINAKKYKHLGAVYIRYISVLENSSDGKLSDICKSMGSSNEEVVKDLQKLIDMKMISDTYIDTNQGLVVGPIVGRKVFIVKNGVRAGIITIKCPSCGALNKGIGKNGCCEYCGSPLNNN